MSKKPNDSNVGDLSCGVNNSKLTPDQIKQNLILIQQRIDEKDPDNGTCDGRHDHYLLEIEGGKVG